MYLHMHGISLLSGCHWLYHESNVPIGPEAITNKPANSIQYMEGFLAIIVLDTRPFHRDKISNPFSKEKNSERCKVRNRAEI